MTTTVTSTIRSSGGDYTSLSAWFAAKQGDISTATGSDEIQVASCYNDWPSGLSDNVDITGATTDATGNYKVTCPDSEYHGGIPLSGFYLKQSLNGVIVSINQGYTVVEKIESINTRPYGGSSRCFTVNENTSILRRVLVSVGGTSSDPTLKPQAIFLSPGSAGSTLESTLVYCYSGGTYGIGIRDNNTSGTMALNNIVAIGFTGAGSIGLFSKYGAGVFTNCVGYGNDTDISGGTNTNCASSDATASGTGSITGITSAAFNDAASNDYHLSGTGSVLYHAGTNSAVAANDVDGDAFDASTPSIGFDEYVATSGADLAGDATIQASATASLATEIPLAGGAIAVSSASGIITTGIKLEANAAAVTIANGILSSTIKLDAAALSEASAIAGMSSAIALLVGADAQASATADLTAPGFGADLAGDAQAVASGIATLIVQIRLAGDAIANIMAGADLTASGTGLSADAQAQASASAVILTAIPLQGAALSVSSADGSIITLIPLQAAAASVVTASGSLDIALTLNAHAAAQVLAGGDLTAIIRFNADAVASAAASGALSGGAYTAPPKIRQVIMAAETRRIVMANETRRVTL